MAKSKFKNEIGAGFLKQGKHFLRSFTGTEELGRAFDYQVTFYSDNAELKPDEVIGADLYVRIERNEHERYFHGVICDFSYLGVSGGYSVYRAELRPHFWLLTQQYDCRIFQNETVVEIVEKVLGNDSSLVKIKKQLNGSYPKLEYCTQYRESSFDFVCRLLEQVGISFYFLHEEKQHTMVLYDNSNGPEKVPHADDLKFRPPGEAQVGEEHISRLQSSYRLRSTTAEINDYDFERPTADLTAKSQDNARHQHGKMSRYDYPGKYTDATVGTDLSNVMLDEIRQQHRQIRAFGNAMGLAAGHWFKLVEHHERSKNDEYLITRAEYDIESGEIEQLGDARNRFEVTMSLIEKKMGYRTPRETPRPFVRGPQSAVVVGKSGEEIWTDQYGRVKVQFRWDRQGKSDENSSCWIRVAQGWAGKNWGMIHIPRIGQEVVVDFFEGDPDRPVITGCLYNGDNAVPYALPANQTRSGLLTRSSKNAAKENANELRFEDKKDNEEIYFHAEKDFNRVVENNDTLKVGFEKKDPGNQTIEIHNDQIIDIGNDQKLTVKNNQDVKATNGKITIEAGLQIELKVGNSSIVIKSSEVSINATNIKIIGQAKVEVDAATTDVNGSGTLNLKGGMVKIN